MYLQAVSEFDAMVAEGVLPDSAWIEKFAASCRAAGQQDLQRASHSAGQPIALAATHGSAPWPSESLEGLVMPASASRLERSHSSP